MRTPIDLLVTKQALRLISNSDVIEAIIDQNPNATVEELPFRNVCARLSNQLCDRLDETCSLLSLTKRQFIEAALIEALTKADQIIGSEGVWEHLHQQNALQAAAEAVAEEGGK